MFTRCKRQKYYILYTVIFVIICIVAFMPFLINEKTFIWGAQTEDGLSQHFTALSYWGTYLRELFGNLVQGKFHLPMWNMTLGYGADILATLNYYAIGDPLNLLYGLVPAKYTETMYSFMILLRMYLAGFVFMLYCKKMKKHDYSSVLGAIVYVFCGFVFRLGIRHPFFLNPMIYFPLLCLGIEKIYKKEKPYLFIVTTAVAAMSNFYFLYMLTILSFIYAWIRFYSYETKHRIKRFFQTVLRFGGFYLMGIMMAAVILLPSIIGFLGNGRGSGNVPLINLIAYPLRYYVMLFENVIAYGNSGYNTNAGFIPIAGLAILYLLTSERMKHKKYKVAVILCMLAFCFPLFGYALNGFSYASNRWAFAFSFLIAVLVAEVYPWLFAMTRKQELKILFGVVGYEVLISFAEWWNKDVFTNNGAYVAGIILFLFYLLFMVFRYKNIHYKNHMARILVMVLVIIGVGIHGYYRFSPQQGNYIAEFINKEEAVDKLSPDSVTMLKTIDDDSLYRVHAGEQHYKNYGFYHGLNTISGYYSIVDGTVSESLKDFETLGMQYLDKFQGLDDRTALLSLSNVKYVTVKDEGKISRKIKTAGAVPKGFKKIKKEGNVTLYENPYALPFGYTYRTYITKKQYDKLNAVEKEQALLCYGVVEDEIEGLTTENKNLHKNVNVDTLKFSSKHIRIVEKEKKSSIKVPKHKGQQAYLYIKGLKFKKKNSDLQLEILRANSGKTKGIIVENNGVKRKIFIQSSTSPYYFGREDYIIPVTEGEVVLHFLSKGDYTIEGMNLIMTDEKKTQERLETRSHNVMKQIQYKDNHLTGRVTNRKKKLLCVTIPYSTGWKATVDGKPANIIKTNDMYCGIVLEPGKHKIEMSYVTPGLKIGAVISALGVFVLILYAIIKHRFMKKKRRREEGEGNEQIM